MNKRTTLLAFIITLCLLPGQLSAQTSKLSVEQRGGNLHFVNKRKGIDLAIKNHYFLDVGGFVPTYDKESFLYNGQEFEGLGVDNFHILRTTFEGDLGPKWSYHFMLDYSKRSLKYLSLQVDYHISKNWFVRLGNHRPPVTMGRNYSSTALKNMTTPMGLSLSSARRLGLGLFQSSARNSFGVGLYTKNINDAAMEGFHGRPDLVLATRGTYNVIHKNNQKLMLGLNVEGKWMGEESQNPVVRGGIETSMNGMRFMALKLNDVQAQLNTGMELAFQQDRFLLTGEYLLSSFYHNESTEVPLFHGWNVEASYVFVGKPRGYNRVKGDFSGSPYMHKRGGLEGGLRYTGLSLNHKYDDLLDYRGGIGSAYSAFLTYWSSEHLSFSLQGTYIDHGRCSNAMGAITPVNDNFKGVDLFVGQLRMLLNF